MMDVTKTMRELCADEPTLEGFLVAKGFPFSLDNPIVDLVTLQDVAEVQDLDLEAFVDEFERYRDSGSACDAAAVEPTAAARALAGLGA